MKSNSVSIIIPCYNAERYVTEAVESALSQTMQVTVIVVDDGSTDKSRSILEEYSDRIVLISKENGGVSSARNVGIDHSTSDYIIFLDADDILIPTSAEDHLRIATEHPTAGLIYGSNYIINETGKQIGTNPQSASFRTIQEVAEGQIPAPSQSMYLRKAVVEAGCFDQSIAFGEDMDLILRIGLRYKIVSHDKFVVNYRHHPDQATKKPTEAFKGMMTIIEKYSTNEQHNELVKNIDWKRARKYWKKYFGQFIPLEIARSALNGKILEIPTKSLLYMRTFPQGLFGTFRFLIHRLKRKHD